MRRRDWRIAAAAAGADRTTLRTVVVDDPALTAVASCIERALGGITFDRRLLGTGVGADPAAEELRLTTPLSLRDPTFARLEVAADAVFSLQVDGRSVIDRVDLREPLLATLALPSGTCELEVRFAPRAAGAGAPPASRVTLAFELLPQRAAARALGVRHATQVREPVVRIQDPGALDEQSLVRPLLRGTTGPGDAFLPCDFDRSGRFDLWLHALTPADAGATLEVAIGDLAPRTVALPPAAGWQWHRVASPFDVAAGVSALRVALATDGMRLDQIAWLPSEFAFPRPPPGDRALWDHAWRFDPLGVGIVLDLTGVRPGERFGRVFELEKGGSYRLFAWLKGDDPQRGDGGSELELASATTRMRFLLPPGTPVEEWVALGEVALLAGERIELKGQGDGAPARIALVR
ncbi:MAG: hypothetical protein FJ293_16810 [Planctomycetes bacterium]|nr:hypothetical protein [Planctomycetota bacterium]